MKCPSCNCELELSLKSGRTLIDNKEYNLTEVQHDQVGEKVGEDYASSKNQVPEVSVEKAEVVTEDDFVEDALVNSPHQERRHE